MPVFSLAKRCLRHHGAVFVGIAGAHPDALNLRWLAGLACVAFFGTQAHQRRRWSPWAQCEAGCSASKQVHRLS